MLLARTEWHTVAFDVDYFAATMPICYSALSYADTRDTRDMLRMLPRYAAAMILMALLAGAMLMRAPLRH